MILIFAGTKNGRDASLRLANEGFKVYISTLTEYGAELVNKHENIHIINGKLESNDISKIINNNNITKVIDSTHPYAQNISLNIKDACLKTGTDLIRYERKTIYKYEEIKEFNTYEEICDYLFKGKGNILLTIGSRNIDVFAEKLCKDRVFLRILPDTASIQKAIKLGFKPKQIIAIQGPFSEEFNEIIYKQYNIRYVVTKDSGEVGGTNEKIRAAQELGIEILLLKRPYIEYKTICYSLDELISLCHEQYK